MRHGSRYIFILVFLLLIVSCPFSSAHPGGTDSQGGHHVSGTGEYHYHHGYSAHQHPDGLCPYGPYASSSLSPSSSSSSVSKASAGKVSVETSSGKRPIGDILSDVFLVIVLLLFGFPFMVWLFIVFARLIADFFKEAAARRKPRIPAADYEQQIRQLQDQLFDANLENRRLSARIAILEESLSEKEHLLDTANKRLTICQNTLAGFRAAEQQARSAEAAKRSSTVEYYPFDYTEEQIKNVKKQDFSGVHSPEWWDSVLKESR